MGYGPPERPDSVHVVHPKTGEEAWWPLFDEAKRPLFPELWNWMRSKSDQSAGISSDATTGTAAVLFRFLGSLRAVTWITFGRS